MIREHKNIVSSNLINAIEMNIKAKPFIKWVGGKGQLIEQLEAKLPADFDNWGNKKGLFNTPCGKYMQLIECYMTGASDDLLKIA